MKKCLKGILLFAFVLWGTIVVMVAKSGVNKMLVSKVMPSFTETTTIISKKGNDLVKYSMEKINAISSEISNLNNYLLKEKKADDFFVKEKISNINDIKGKLEFGKDKNEFMNLETFREKLGEYVICIDNYIDTVSGILENEDISMSEELKTKKDECDKLKLILEEIILTFEVN